MLKSSPMRFKNIVSVLGIGALGLYISACSASGENPGREFAPQMYHSVAYEPLTQIKDESQGKWLSNREDGKGEFFNSNVNNPSQMNMRVPPANTVRRSQDADLPYRVAPADYDLAGETVKNPHEVTADFIAEGKILYGKFCQQCHGETGLGDGKVGEVFLGVPAYNVGRVADLTEGHIFHTITHGRGRMGAHASQIQMADRWKIVAYVQELQKK